MKNATMKAVILAAGKGKRMGDLTKTLPKPMVPIHGKPILEHIITGLRDHTPVRDFFIITGHCAEVIEDHFGDGSAFGVHVSYGRQEVQNGTGKAPEIAKDWLGESNFVLSYGDVLIRPENYGVIHNSLSEEAEAVMAVSEVEDVSKLGAVLRDADGWMTEIVEKPEPGTVDTRWVNAGVYVFRSHLFEDTAKLELSPRGEYELTDALKAITSSGRKIMTPVLTGDWADVRDQAILAELNEKKA